MDQMILFSVLIVNHLNSLYTGYGDNMKSINIKELKENVRHPYAWPGGYEIVFITSDGCILCHNCIRSNWREILWSTKNHVADGWEIVGFAIEAVDYESTLELAGDDYTSNCAHCDKEFGEMG